MVLKEDDNKAVPYIFDIQHSSNVDGPGIRTTIFVKGCNLRCAWCHNPESQTSEPQLAFFREKCRNCGVCSQICQNKSCISCGNCVKFCAYGARKLYGRKYTKAELMHEILADKMYYEATGGGVTVSGGECMLYPDFLADLFAECRANGINTAADTAGNIMWESFEEVLPYTNMFLYDIKAITPELHKKGTGADNSLILQNLEKLIAVGAEIIIRVPVIPGFNDGEELEKIREYIDKHSLKAEYLKYHNMGEGKKQALEDAKLLKKAYFVQKRSRIYSDINTIK